MWWGRVWVSPLPPKNIEKFFTVVYSLPTDNEIVQVQDDINMGGAPIEAGGITPPLFEAKGDGDIIWG